MVGVAVCASAVGGTAADVVADADVVVGNDALS